MAKSRWILNHQTHIWSQKAVSLRFSFTATKRLNVLQHDNALVALNPIMNISGMNWNVDCTLGLLR